MRVYIEYLIILCKIWRRFGHRTGKIVNHRTSKIINHRCFIYPKQLAEI